jgi:hypothetical protein
MRDSDMSMPTQQEEKAPGGCFRAILGFILGGVVGTGGAFLSRFVIPLLPSSDMTATVLDLLIRMALGALIGGILGALIGISTGRPRNRAPES